MNGVRVGPRGSNSGENAGVTWALNLHDGDVI